MRSHGRFIEDIFGSGCKMNNAVRLGFVEFIKVVIDETLVIAAWVITDK